MVSVPGVCVFEVQEKSKAHTNGCTTVQGFVGRRGWSPQLSGIR